MRWFLLLICTHQVRSTSFYDLKAVDIHGLEVDFDRFKGQALLIVNVASECGFTDSHYRELQRIQVNISTFYFNWFLYNLPMKIISGCSWF